LQPSAEIYLTLKDVDVQNPEDDNRCPAKGSVTAGVESASLQLTNMTRWAHLMLEPVLESGGFAVDLTAGNGHDTLFLWRRVGPEGAVLAFDVQLRALHNTSRRLAEAGAPVHRLEPGQSIRSPERGVFLIRACHSALAQLCKLPPVAIMANLGYLPGGDHELVTHQKTTLNALCRASELLAAGGRIVVTAYPGHPGGQAESRAVQEFFASLDARQWLVLNLCSGNRPHAPILLVAEKRRLRP
jgi:hypothetical protein